MHGISTVCSALLKPVSSRMNWASCFHNPSLNTMVIVLLIVSVLNAAVTNAQCSNESSSRRRGGGIRPNPEIEMTSSEIIKSRGYPVEIHSVTTDDGYVLRLHRIPSTRGKLKRQTRPIFLLYGYMGTDAIWSIPPANRSLAYMLADRGYDVWMGNSRGNSYSRQHLWLDPEQAEFWDFSWDEMGRYDIPANLKYILKVTKQKRLVYIGNSFANTLFFIAMATNPELNENVELMIALAPVAGVTRAKSPMVRFLIPAINQIKGITVRRGRRLGTGPLVDNGYSKRDPMRLIQRLVCERDFIGASFCREVLFSITGINRDNFDLELLPGINQYIPAGISFNSLAQFAQQPPPGQYMAAFDYGSQENVARYGTAEPPVYNLKLVTAPVHIFWSRNDFLTPLEDIQLLSSQLGNVKSVVQVSDPCFNHFDFLIGLNVYQVLYVHVLALIPSP